MIPVIIQFFSTFLLLLFIYASENSNLLQDAFQIVLSPSRPKLLKIQTSIII